MAILLDREARSPLEVLGMTHCQPKNGLTVKRTIIFNKSVGKKFYEFYQ